jgi:O-succinylbenzoate synthase
VPLCVGLGSQVAPIPSGAAIGLFPTVDELLQRVERFLREGYCRIKIKIAPGQDIELVRAVRQRFGPIPLMVDANAAYSPNDDKLFIELDKFRLLMIEQPFAKAALEQHAQLQAQLKTPICLDESVENLAALREIIRLRSARIINIKVQRMGGLWPAKLAHDMARDAGLPCWLGTMPELGIASVQGLHLATLPNFVYPTDVEASERWFVNDIVTPLIRVDRDGIIRGIDKFRVDAEKIARYRLRLEELRG